MTPAGSHQHPDPMTHFHYVNQRLHCDGVDLATISAEIGTPVYVYSQQAIVERVSAVGTALQTGDLACYAVKANSNLALLKLMARHGLGADVTSGGELFLALKAGFAPDRILFSGVGKTSAEIQQALDADIRAIHVESEMELRAIAAIADQRNQLARIGIRVNPDIAASTHPAISTGRASHKFGVSAEMALHLLQFAANHPHLHPIGLAAHIGSQIRDLPPFRQVATFLAWLRKRSTAALSWPI